MRKLIFIFFLIFFVSVQGQNPIGTSSGEFENQTKGTQTNANYSYKIIPSIHSTWGYDVYKGEKIFIHQPNIPGMPGNDGFKTKSDAKKVARLVVEKLKNGEMPPTVTTEELKNLKVLLTN